MTVNNTTTTKGNTMTIIITNVSRHEECTLVSLNTEKHTLEVIIRASTSYLAPVTVVNRNASSRAWNRHVSAGKDFNSVAEAIANYKTPAIKEMIALAAETV